ncbi:hypothetical protein BJV78DRAFT_187181 [Lactifluus subvellereus]|nr:hypothetical protein BJV78DRAFT_187181 [Lactifluus subvellereus]
MLLLHVALCSLRSPSSSPFPASAIPAHRGQPPPVKVSTQCQRVGPYRLQNDDPHEHDAILHWAGTRYPQGPIDFTIDIERALRVLDEAVLVLCAVSGVKVAPCIVYACLLLGDRRHRAK